MDVVLWCVHSMSNGVTSGCSINSGLVFLLFLLAVVGVFYYFIHFIESTMWLFHRLQCNVAGITMT